MKLRYILLYLDSSAAAAPYQVGARMAPADLSDSSSAKDTGAGPVGSKPLGVAAKLRGDKGRSYSRKEQERLKVGKRLPRVNTQLPIPQPDVAVIFSGFKSI